ncbi:MAG: 5-formyltetrahydrofolate cyclo-ligase [Tissierellia bacterium]|nr:5-formyltetrahydrofolate cyclo-ligase [Tissierellia bacterium]
MEKTQIRKHFVTLRDQMPLEERIRASEKIFEELKATDSYQSARSIFLFYSMASEVMTASWLQELLEEKRVYLPYIEKGEKQMKMTELLSLEDLEVGHWGLTQMKKSLLPERWREEVDLTLVPGLAFDNEGYRVGYGGGYYDRFLSGHQTEALGLGFALQRVEALPHQDYDVPVPAFLSEKGLEVFTPRRP